MNIGCNFGGVMMNLLAYADDMVLIAPSWHALQNLIQVAADAAGKISMSFNTKKTVCMVFNPFNRRSFRLLVASSNLLSIFVI